MNPEPGPAPAAQILIARSGSEIVALIERLKGKLFRFGLRLALGSCIVAALLVVLAGRHVGLRLVILVVLIALAGLRGGELDLTAVDESRAARADSGDLAADPGNGASAATARLYRAAAARFASPRVRRALLITTVLAVGLAVGDARDNAELFVCALGVGTIPIVLGRAVGLACALIVDGAYAVSLLAWHHELLGHGSPGDLAAMVSLLVVVLVNERVVHWMSGFIWDINDALIQTRPDPLPSLSREARAELSRQVIALHSADRRRLSELGLSDAELSVVLLVGDGLNYSEVARILDKKVRTVSNQMDSARMKRRVDGSEALVYQVFCAAAGRAPDPPRPHDARPRNP